MIVLIGRWRKNPIESANEVRFAIKTRAGPPRGQEGRPRGGYGRWGRRELQGEAGENGDPGGGRDAAVRKGAINVRIAQN